MKAVAVLFAFSAMAFADTPVVLSSPVVRPASVVSPLTSSTAASNQQLMTQVTNTLQNRRLNHQIVTTQAAIRSQVPALQTAPRIVIQQK